MKAISEKPGLVAAPGKKMDLDFYHHICNFCRSVPHEKNGKTMKFPTCSGCRLVSYCSRSHQKSDWRNHKNVCTTIQNLIQQRGGTQLFSFIDSPTPEGLFNYQTDVIRTVEKQLAINLKLSERSAIYFPNICEMCFKPNREVVCCEKCETQFYCSERHKVEHSVVHRKDCEALKFHFALFNFLHNCNGQRTELKIKSLQQNDDFPKSSREFVSKYTVGGNVYDESILSEISSYSLTLIYCLRECLNTSSKNNLTIHIVGASLAETRMLTILSMFVAWLKVESLEFVFVGPECDSYDEEYINNLIDEYSSVNLKIGFHNLLYHRYYHRSKIHPDVVVAFNCGFHEFKGLSCDTWEETLNLILTFNDIILVTTSYTKIEAEKDARSVLKNDDMVMPIKLCQVNDYMSLNPHRSPERLESSVFYSNQFLSIFRIK